MKPLLILFIVSAFASFAAEPDLKALLQKGLVAEEADGDLAAAAKAYEELVKAGDAQQKLIATALFRLAEVKRKQNQNDEAAKLYQRVVADFSSQETLAKLARENLTALGHAMPDQVVAASASVPIAEAKRKLAELRVEHEHLLTSMRPAHPEVLRLEAQIARAKDLVNQLDDGPESAEIARMETLLTESPDRAKQEFPLHLAALKGWSRLAATMLKRGFEVNQNCYPGDREIPAEVKRYIGYSPLSVAAAEGNKVVAEALIQGGARLDIGLTETGENSSTLNSPWIAIGRGRLEIIKLLLKQKQKLGGRASIGSTPWGEIYGTALAKAVDTADIAPEVVTLLLAAGFDAGESLILSSDQQKPQPDKTLPLLSLACSTGRTKTVEALIGAGAQVNAVGSDGTTPFFHTGSNDEIAALLIEHGADINVRDKSGATPFLGLLAYPSVLKLLLTKGADPKATDNEGRTALHICAQQGIADHEVYKLLLSLPIDPNQKDKAGKTALEYALEWHQGQRSSNQPPPDFDLYLTARTQLKDKAVWSYTRTRERDEFLSQIYAPMAEDEPLPTLAEFALMLRHFRPEPLAENGNQPGLPVIPQPVNINRPAAPGEPARRRVPAIPGASSLTSSPVVSVMHHLGPESKVIDWVTHVTGEDEVWFRVMQHGDALLPGPVSAQTWQTFEDTLLKKLALKITVSFHGIERTFVIGPGDPWHPTAPRLSFGSWDEILSTLTRRTLPLDLTKVKVVRVLNGRKIEKVINVRTGRPASWPRLMSGDRLELPALPNDREKMTVLLPDTGYAETMLMPSGQRPHLCTLLHTARFSRLDRNQIGLPLGRDWSRVTIWRKGKEQPETYDLLQAVTVAGDGFDAKQAAQAEPQLDAGDRVELPPLKDWLEGEPPKDLANYIEKVGSVLINGSVRRTVAPTSSEAGK